MDSNKPSTGVGLAVGFLGALAAIGGAVAMGSSKKSPNLRGSRPLRSVKKPCGCGR